MERMTRMLDVSMPFKPQHAELATGQFLPDRKRSSTGCVSGTWGPPTDSDGRTFLLCQGMRSARCLLAGERICSYSISPGDKKWHQ